MKTLFYFFGVRRGEKIFTLTDPIYLEDDFKIFSLGEYSLKNIFNENKLDLRNILEEVKEDIGILFGFSQTSNKVNNFLKFGKLLSPTLEKEPTSIYFLDDKKLIIIKINKDIDNWKNAKKEIWKILNSLKIISKHEFIKNTKDWKDYEGEYEECVNDFSFKTNKLDLSTGNYYHLFLGLKSNNYEQLKNKIKKNFKEKRDFKISTGSKSETKYKK